MTKRTQWSALAFLVLSLAGCTRDDQPSQVFVTEFGTGPDKWATAWLLSQHLYPESVLEIQPSPLARSASNPVEYPNGVLFDIPSAEIRRSSESSAFEAALAMHSKESDPALTKLAQIIHDMEVNYWGGNRLPETLVVSQAYRVIHRQQSDETARQECYLAFFESVYQSLALAHRQEKQVNPDLLLDDCEQVSRVAVSEKPLVPEIPISDILKTLRNGEKVAFIDVREPGEYAEAHIPGAYNVTLRDLNTASIETFRNAKYVVSYCVKDFRGFEMAKELRRRGLEGSVILNPYGIKGWITAGLPVAGSDALPEKRAKEQLARCIADSTECGV